MSLLTDLLAYWKMDESSGDATDAHGSNTLTDHGSVGTAAGRINTARSFDGAAQYLSLPGNFGFGATSGAPFSVSLWAYCDTVAGNHVLLGRIEPGGTNVFMIWSGGANFLASYGPVDTLWSPSIAANTWYHIAFTFSASGEGRLYLDGTLVDSDTSPSGDFTSTQPLNVGRRGGDANSPFAGRVDELAVWSRELTPAEVVRLYGAGAGLAYASFADPAAGSRTPLGLGLLGRAAAPTAGPTAVSDSDAAAGADSATLTADATRADSGSGADAGAVTSGLADADSGAGLEGTVALAALLGAADSGTADDPPASVTALLSDGDSAAGADASGLLLGVSSADSGAGSDDGSVDPDVTTVEVASADAGAGVEGDVSIAAAPADDELPTGMDNAWVLADTVGAPYRDRQLLRLLADALRDTAEFDEVLTAGLPEDHGRTASDLRLACLELDHWADSDHWGDFDSTEQVRTVAYTLHLLVRAEDPDLRDDELDRLASVASNALNGIPLGDVSIPNRTRLLRGRYQPAAGPERRMAVAGQFTYTLPDFGRHAAAEDA